jgi:hypothetical protein
VKLSQSQQQEFKEELQPLLQPYFDHQGWPSLDAADTATQVLLDFFRELGVRV